MGPRPRHRHVLYLAAGLLAVAGLVAAGVGAADASGRSYRIGSGVSVSRVKSQPSTAAPTARSTPTSSPNPTNTAPTPTDPAVSPSPSPTDSTAQPPATDCGGTTLQKPDGSAWVCTFDDEFDGTAIDRSKWSVQTTAASGFHSGAECFMDDSNNLSVSDGSLKLTVRKESEPFTCSSPTGSYQTQYTSGTVNGYGKFAQTYGMFEVRAKFPDTTVKGLQETLWLWPVDPQAYGRWPASGEIDFAEVYSAYQGWNIPYLHYDVDQSTVSWATNTNVYTALPAPNNQPGMACSFDASAFNTYTVIWQPGTIVLQVNHRNCVVDNYSASNAGSPAPFDQPFFIALTQALGIGGNAFVEGTTPLPATTEVDYVRIWK